MEGQARRTEYAVTDAACFRVRFTQRPPTVKAFCVSRSWAGIADRICRMSYFNNFTASYMEYVHSCFYSENAPKVHNVPYRTREIFMSLVIEADEFERGCKQAASPDAEEMYASFFVYTASNRRYTPTFCSIHLCPNQRAGCRFYPSTGDQQQRRNRGLLRYIFVR